jgi:hypothetical protein
LEGLVLYGELPSSWPNMLLNYLAFKEYCFHPDLSREGFTVKRLAPLYGEDLTADLWRVIELTRDKRSRQVQGNVAKALETARAAPGRAPAHTQAHWQNLVRFLESSP